MQRGELEAAVRRGRRFKYLLFWGHTAPGGGGSQAVGEWILSQWWSRHPFEVDGVRYGSAEHFMMAEKARLMGDREKAAAIVSAPNAAAAKRLGRAVAPWDQELWERERFAIVVRGNQAKFGQHRDLRDFLLATGKRVLVEASPRDRIWGIGLSRDDERARDPRRWRGLNLLGFALMEVRRRLREGRG